MSDAGYINYFEILGVTENANPGEVRKNYKRRMKELVSEIAREEITDDRRAHYLLEMAQLNAAVHVLRDKDKRAAYWDERSELIALEEEWCGLGDGDPEASDRLRRRFDGGVRSFLSKYIEEATLEAGQDKEVRESSHWNDAHARHATRILRHYRQRLYQDILERLPYYEVTRPVIDWEERRATIGGLIEEATR